MKALGFALLFAGTVATTACATSHTKDRGSWGSPYSGIQCDSEWTVGLLGAPVLWIFLPFAIIDIPLSLVADTLVLPYDLAVKTKDRKVECSLMH